MKQRGIARHGEWSEAEAGWYNKALTKVKEHCEFVGTVASRLVGNGAGAGEG
jgi:hypothetical protein